MSQPCPEPEGTSSELEAQVPLETGQEMDVSTGLVESISSHAARYIFFSSSSAPLELSSPEGQTQTGSGFQTPNTSEEGAMAPG